MDAVQISQIAAGPAGILQGGAAPQVVPGDSAASQLFRMVFEEAAGSVRVQEGVTGVQALSPVVASNALQASETFPEGESQAESAEAQASHRIPVVPGSAEAAREKATARGAFPGMKGEGAKKGGAAGARLEQALMENRQFLEMTDEKAIENPSGKRVGSGSDSGEETVAAGKGSVEKGEDCEEEMASELKLRSRMSESGAVFLPPLQGESMETERVVIGRSEVMPVRARAALEAGRGEVVRDALNRESVYSQAVSDVIMQERQNDLKQEMKGESVYRRLPGGVTVQTPAVTAATENRGASEISVTPMEVKPGESIDAATASPADSKNGRVFHQAAVETGEVDAAAGKTHFGRLDKVNINYYSRTGMQDQKQEVQGDTVYRQLPGGVTVMNPSRTTAMGNSPFRDAAVFQAEGEPKGRLNSSKTEEALEQAGKPTETAARKTEPSPAGGGMGRRQDPDTGDGSRAYQVTQSSFGEVERTVREEFRPSAGRTSGETEARLHEAVVSQVRDRLADPALVAGGGRISLKLNPGELGELQMNVRMEDRRMSVEITSSNPVVKEALLQNVEQLKENLSRQNISMERFDVSTGAGHQGGQSFRERRRPEYRQIEQVSLNPGLYPPEETAEVRLAGWESGGNRLVDMRL